MATETAEHASGGFPPFDQIDTFASQIFWLVVTFAVLYFVLSNVLLPKIKKAIEDRDSTIAGNIKEAAALSEQADDAVAKFEADIARAKAAARDTASKARAEADAKIAAETARVESELAVKLVKAEAEIGAMRTAALSNVGAVAEDVASAIVEKLTGAKADPATVKNAVSAASEGR